MIPEGLHDNDYPSQTLATRREEGPEIGNGVADSETRNGVTDPEIGPGTSGSEIRHGESDLEPAKLAVWQTEPCPPWCLPNWHGDNDDPEDRYHSSPIDDVPMRLVRAVEMDRGEWVLSTLRVYLHQEMPGGVPVVHMFNDDHGLLQLDLMLEEAEQLADVLRQAIATAAGAQR